MSAGTVALGLSLGLVAGGLSGLFGVGGGILFVPLLVALGLGQLEASATSLLAIVPTAAAGIWQQSRYGNFRMKPALVLGVASLVGVEAGVRIATSLPESTLRRLFGVLLLGVATQLALRAARRRSHVEVES
ncbi:MAG: sulfite exporter TauE/SafE family protein [Gaiellaceae bacterium]